MRNVANGTERSSYQAGGPVEDDEERLAMKKGDMPPPLPRRVSNAKIRDDQALHDFSQTPTRCIVPHLVKLTHEHVLITVDHLSSHNL